MYGVLPCTFHVTLAHAHVHGSKNNRGYVDKKIFGGQHGYCAHSEQGSPSARPAPRSHNNLLLYCEQILHNRTRERK